MCGLVKLLIVMFSCAVTQFCVVCLQRYLRLAQTPAASVPDFQERVLERADKKMRCFLI
jgi:hypothetical protein